MKRVLLKRVRAFVLAGIMACGLILYVDAPFAVQASEAEVRTVNLDTSYLAPSEDSWDAETDHKVEFGVYDGSVTKYRVLKASEKQLLLDCDTVLTAVPFDRDDEVNAGQSENHHNGWVNSDLELWLNGSEYYGNADVFTAIEKNAIVSSSLAASSADYKVKSYGFKDYSAQDHIFLLSAEESNTLYADDASRVKGGSIDAYWLRSADAKLTNVAGYVNNKGVIAGLTANCYSAGISPAFRLDTTEVLFTSVSGLNKTRYMNITDTLTTYKSELVTANDMGITWTLTFCGGTEFAATQGNTEVTSDGRVSVTIDDLGKDSHGDAVSVDYYSQLSAMLVDEEGNVLAYGQVKEDAEVGAVDILLPGGIVKGDYKLHVFAEKVFSADEVISTDYASNMETFEITVLETIEKEKLLSISQDATLTVANATALKDMLLPKKVPIVTNRKIFTEAVVDWHISSPTYLDGTSYDPSEWKEQVFVLEGNVICPSRVDINDVDLSTRITITVEAGEKPASAVALSTGLWIGLSAIGLLGIGALVFFFLLKKKDQDENE